VGTIAKLQTLQVARGVAANLVVLAHLYDLEAKYTAGSLLPPATVYGVAGVDLFFVLSGFIMVAVAGRNTGRCNSCGGARQKSIRRTSSYRWRCSPRRS
jgi:exopolysaccharide production protein ExoZ